MKTLKSFTFGFLGALAFCFVISLAQMIAALVMWWLKL